jgi:hypothetical protein
MRSLPPLGRLTLIATSWRPKWLNAMRRYRLCADIAQKRLGLPLWRILLEGLVKNFAELLLLLFWIP